MARKLKQRKPAKREKDALNATYFKSLDALVDKLFSIAYKQKMTWASMADLSGLSRETICKLGNRETKFPQLRTVELLARALGGKLDYAAGTERAAVTVKWRPKMFNAGYWYRKAS